MTVTEERIELPEIPTTPPLDPEGGGGEEETPYIPLLLTWQAVLEPAHDQRGERITPQWANRIIGAYHGIGFADMELFRDIYYDRVAVLYKILLDQIETDPEAIKVDSAAEDRARNALHYVSIIADWQAVFLRWELSWNTLSTSAAVDIASLAEIHRMFFDQTGLIGLLDNIQFEFTEDHQKAVQETLQAVIEEYGEGR